MPGYFRKIFSLFNKRDHRFLIFLVFSIVFTAMVELMGIGALFPYIKILGDQALIHKNHFLNYFYTSLHFKSNDSFLIFVGVLIFLMIIFKGGMSVFNNYFQTRFTSGLNVRLSRFCFESYLTMPYADLLSKNSSVLTKHILVDVIYAVLVLTGILVVMTDVFVSFSLLALMLFVEFKLVLVVITVLVSLLWLSTKGIKSVIRKVGKQNELYNQKMFKVSSEALQGLRDVRVYSVENFFLRHYMYWREKAAKNLITYNVVSNIPVTLMNVVGFGMLLLILLYLMITHGSLVSILPIVGIIAVCVQRMMPAASRISMQLGIIRQYESNLTIVADAVASLKKKENVSWGKQEGGDTRIVFSKQLTFRNIDYIYPAGEKKALDNINLNIKKGMSLGIVGPSGAGKTTLVDVLLGLFPVSHGEILCDDLVISQQNYQALHQIMGYVPQQTYLLDGTIKENIAFGIDSEDISEGAIERSIKIAQLKEFVAKLPKGLDTLIGEKGVCISGGQRQRIGIARALYNNPDIVIMDEATNALDLVTESEFNEALKLMLGEKTLIIIAHRHSSIKFCDELIVLDKGRIVDRGTHEQLSKHSSLYRDLYCSDLSGEVISA